MQPFTDFGGAGTVIHVAPANGFPSETYQPMFQPLTEQYRVVSLPPRALWPDEQPPEDGHDWSMVADDLLNGFAQYDLRDVIAIGHSFGGIASILATIQQPERFRALVLLDPTMLPPSAMEAMAQMQADGSIHEFPLAAGAVKRKRRWESVGEAYHYFRGKPLFQNWSDEAVRLYAGSGTRTASDGGVELVWPPEWEAYYFRTLYTKTWDELPKLRLPTLVVRGGESDTFTPESYAAARELMPGADFVEVPGHGHLFPHSAPDETYRIIRDWLATLL
jgi:pimeloyl-ACP methyl ester carboxylesterase